MQLDGSLVFLEELLLASSESERPQPNHTSSEMNVRKPLHLPHIPYNSYTVPVYGFCAVICGSTYIFMHYRITE